MEGYEVIVELKTGKRHQGRLTAGDNNVNLMLEVVEQEPFIFFADEKSNMEIVLKIRISSTSLFASYSSYLYYVVIHVS